MANMNEVVTRGILEESLEVTKQELMLVMQQTFAAFEERLMGRFGLIDERFMKIDERFEAIESKLGNLDARMELGFSELNERLDAEQAFTSDMWDDFSSRLAVLEAK